MQTIALKIETDDALMLARKECRFMVVGGLMEMDEREPQNKWYAAGVEAGKGQWRIGNFTKEQRQARMVELHSPSGKRTLREKIRQAEADIRQSENRKELYEKYTNCVR